MPLPETKFESMMEAVWHKEVVDADLEHWELSQGMIGDTPGLILPELLGYTIIRLAGKGSFARVYQAQVTRTGELIAVKIPFAPGQVDRRRDRIHRSIIKHEAAVLDAVRGGVSLSFCRYLLTFPATHHHRRQTPSSV